MVDRAQQTAYIELSTKQPDGDQLQTQHQTLEQSSFLEREYTPKNIWSWDERRRTISLINCSAIIERVDEQLLPALYSRVGQSFSATPAQLGVLTLARALAQALASPCAGVLGQYANRITVICAGAAVWGAMTAAFSSTHSISAGLPFWFFNGIGLAFLIPAAQSLTADYNPEERRGRAFGVLHLVGAVGALLGTLFATNIAHLHVLGLEGWRFAFLAVALLSWIIGGATWIFGADPRYTLDLRYKVESAAEAHPLGSSRNAGREVLRDVYSSVLSVPTFGIIVLQGIVGTTPWSALVFLTFYFQLLGMGDWTASCLLSIFLAANAAGGLLGGIVGDAAARRWPDHGRIFACQFSVGVGVPLSFILFKALPLSASSGAVIGHAAVLCVTGLLITWAATACNNPIFSEIVPPHMRNLIYAFDRSFEGAIAAAGAPLVGILAEKAFGFSGTAEVSADDSEANLRKAQSLGKALLLFTTVPWFLCTIFFSGLHWTYPRDRRRARAQQQQLHEQEERQPLEID